jgi:2-polyprenyl-3-methyl-5-hydroxy-6-metoxy-1,4-benzoquinol methylase
MDLKERLAGAERRHPWEIARARSYRKLIAAHTDLAIVRSVLDIGAGDGWFASDIRGDLAEPATIVCWDINYRSEDLASPTGPGLTRTRDRPVGLFDVVLALDVLEHIADDEEFLADVIVPLMGPAGIGLLSVPAHPRLYSDHDRMLEHERRYRPAAFRTLVGRHLDVVAAGSLFSTLVPVRAVDALRQKAGRGGEQTGVGSWSSGPRATRAVTAVLEADATIGRGAARIGMPLLGLSTWTVVRRR